MNFEVTMKMLTAAIVGIGAAAPTFATAQVRSSSAAPSLEEVMAPLPDEDDVAQRFTVPWTGAAGTGVAIALENGNWGGQWTQGLRLRVPVGPHLGLHLRGMVVADFDIERWDVGGRLDAVGQSPVILNVMRLYGGGGVQLFRPVTGVDAPQTKIGFGGHFGFEFFMSEWLSWILEVGGNSGGQDAFGAGATVVGGIQFHPFSG